MQLIDLKETYEDKTSKSIVSQKKEIKCTNIIKRYKND